MEKTLKFNSQIATSLVQSERLLALGLKKETADMVHFFSSSLAQDWTIVPLADGETARYIQGLEIPAWSLHRLMILAEMKGTAFSDLDDAYETTISIIAEKIRFGYFNKEYLENGN